MKGKGKWIPEKRSPYIKTLTRNECSIIFRARTRMLDIKNNFRGKYTDNLCRACNTVNETQDHILNQCPIIHRDNNMKITNEDIFEDNTASLKPVASKIQRIMHRITN